MVDSKQDRLAKEVIELSISFKMALSNKRKYPMAEFKSFVAAAKRYVEALGKDALIHREVVSAINGLREFLETERKQVPGKFSRKLIDWNVSFLLPMIHTSRGTSRQAFSVKPILLKPHLRETNYAATWIDRLLQQSFATLPIINKLATGSRLRHSFCG